MNILFIRNPRSGSAKEVDKFLEILEKKATVDYYELKVKEPIEHSLDRAEAHDLVIIAGGDGTIASASYAMRNLEVPLMIYPAGSGNLLAANLGMPSSDKELAELALKGKPKSIDLAEIHCKKKAHPREPDKYGFITNAGAGIDASVVEEAKPLKKKFGPAAYFLGMIKSVVNAKPAKFTIELDGKKITTEGIGVQVLNFGKIHYGIPVVKLSDPTDGLLEVMIVKNKAPRNVLKAIMQALIDKQGLDREEFREILEVQYAKQVKISSEPSLRIQYDGEITEYETPFEARILPKAIKIIRP